MRRRHDQGVADDRREKVELHLLRRIADAVERIANRLDAETDGMTQQEKERLDAARATLQSSEEELDTAVQSQPKEN